MSFHCSFTCWSKKLSHLLILAILQLTIDFFSVKVSRGKISRLTIFTTNDTTSRFFSLTASSFFLFYGYWLTPLRSSSAEVEKLSCGEKVTTLEKKEAERYHAR